MDDIKRQRVMNQVRKDVSTGTATIYVSRQTYAELHAIAQECGASVSEVVEQMVSALKRSKATALPVVHRVETVFCNECFAKRKNQSEKSCTHGCRPGKCHKCGKPYGHGGPETWGHCPDSWEPEDDDSCRGAEVGAH